MNPNPTPITKRQVFYIPGYDPMPPRRYRELYRRESKKQADISGYNISQTKLDGPLGWRVHSEIDGRQTDADITVLYWADLVQDSMRAGLVQGFYLLLRTAWIYLSSGALRRLMLLRKGPVIAALYPVVMMLFQLFVAIGAGVLALAAFQGLVGLISGIAIYLAVLIGFYRLDNRLFAYYLMYDYAFSSGENGATPQVLVTRMAQFRRDIEQGLDSEADEVLVVGHSSGAHLGISIIADILRSGHPKAEKLAFLSLGQVVPMVSFLPLARELRRDLAYLSTQEQIAWVDVTAPGDGCSFALCDPVAVSGVAPDDQKWPLVISAAFTQTLLPQTWKRLRWRFFRLHFQYLCAFDRPGDYDYFKITAGSVSLADRFQGRQSSRNRISIPVSPYRDVAK